MSIIRTQKFAELEISEIDKHTTLISRKRITKVKIFTQYISKKLEFFRKKFMPN